MNWIIFVVVFQMSERPVTDKIPFYGTEAACNQKASAIERMRKVESAICIPQA